MSEVLKELWQVEASWNRRALRYLNPLLMASVDSVHLQGDIRGDGESQQRVQLPYSELLRVGILFGQLEIEGSESRKRSEIRQLVDMSEKKGFLNK